jgi:hypothetical protein
MPSTVCDVMLHMLVSLWVWMYDPSIKGKISE